MDGAFRGRVREMCVIERGSCQNTVGYPLSPPSVLGHNCKYVSLHAIVNIVSPLKAAFFLQETNGQRSINSLYRYSLALLTLLFFKPSLFCFSQIVQDVVETLRTDRLF